MDDERWLSVSRRVVVLTLVGVCVLSAAVGSGITLLAKTGPQGPRGPVGAEGPPGDSAQQASYEAEEAAEHADQLDSRLSEVELELPGGEAASVSDLNNLEWQMQDLEGSMSRLCRELGTFC